MICRNSVAEIAVCDVRSFLVSEILRNGSEALNQELRVSLVSEILGTDLKR